MSRGVQADTETQHVAEVADPWHLEPAEVAAWLGVDPGRGLDSAEAGRRLRLAYLAGAAVMLVAVLQSTRHSSTW